MSVFLELKCHMHNETAKKGMENFVKILQNAFEHYQNLWKDYIKLQEKYEQRNICPSSQVTADKRDMPICTKIKDEPNSQQLNNVNMSENDSIPLLEPETLNIGPINFNFDTKTDLSDLNESLHKDTDGNSPSKSPVFRRTSLRNDSNFARKRFPRYKVTFDNLNSDMKTHDGVEKISSKYNHKLDISTTHHVETTFLPNGKKLKQSRLAFYPVKNNEETALSPNINVVHDVKQDPIEDIFTANTITTTENNVTSSSENSEDVIEISPTQRNITSKVKYRLKLKRKVSAKQIKISPKKNKTYCSTVPEITIDDMDFGLCLPKHISIQAKNDKSLDSTTLIENSSPIKIHNETNVQIRKSVQIQKKNQSMANKEKNTTKNINDIAFEDKTFYLPAERTANRNDVDDFYLDNSENEPPKKKILPKRKTDVSEQLNIRCKADRAKLNGWDCWECREYYENLPLSKEELQKRKNQCSRHRHKYERPRTPEGFWDPEFPETLSSTYRQN
ncbi:hypothetical protein P5V15_007598 [Pogonomyrmex californicus]